MPVPFNSPGRDFDPAFSADGRVVHARYGCGAHSQTRVSEEKAPAAAFERLAAAADAVRRVVPDAAWMSAGMSGDFAEAIAAGATHLRIGTAITGSRPEAR